MECFIIIFLIFNHILQHTGVFISSLKQSLPGVTLGTILHVPVQIDSSTEYALLYRVTVQ